MSEEQIGQLHQLPPQLLLALLSPDCPATQVLNDGVDEDQLSLVDWSSLAQDANRHRVSLLMYHRLVELGLTGLLPPSVSQAWKADALHAELQNVLQHRDAIRISQGLSQRGIRHAFIKGFAYRAWLYRPPWVRIGGDIDLLIDPRNVEPVRRAMRDLGFIQASCTNDYQHFRPATSREIAKVEANHYELAQFVKDYRLNNPPDWLFGPDFVRRVPFAYESQVDGVIFHSSVDIHWAIHFAFADASPLDQPQNIRVERETGMPRLSTEWNIFISIFKLYFEAFDRPRYGFHHLIDLIALLRAGQSDIDWKAFRELIQRYQLDAAAFYTLSASERLAGQSLVPPDLINEWAEFTASPPVIQTNSTSLDFGDFVPYMIGRRIPSDLGGRFKE